MSELRSVVFKPWSKTDCERCDCEFQISRVHEVTATGDILCNECTTYNEGFKDGVKSKEDVIESLNCQISKLHEMIKYGLGEKDLEQDI